MLLQGCRIIDKICFTQRDRYNPPPENRLPQSSRYRFDLGKFRHKKRAPSKYHSPAGQCSSHTKESQRFSNLTVGLSGKIQKRTLKKIVIVDNRASEIG